MREIKAIEISTKAFMKLASQNRGKELPDDANPEDSNDDISPNSSNTKDRDAPQSSSVFDRKNN